MNRAVTPHRWFAGWRSSERVEADDPAGLGTAFGLDLSMEAGLPHPAPAKPKTGAAKAPGWVQRLGIRRKAAG